ncbi:hypothetical protein PQI07_06550 [Methylobacterium sp. 092160098-2]|uniref:hypothetical protein n=1 Tax=Methylobacterium sp. 092160098-2 TaxID=3025129 RepID=UPI002381C552|nr:hypothetical protein [Methylobacterium sp. 092160098-2]MDE4910361.1 hypothetical protein [Methylobacterium sp. 092160098-2]
MGADRNFPLDAEQIVRLAGSMLAEILNASRHPDSRPVDAEQLTMKFGAATGVPLPIVGEGYGRVLLPYGVTPSTDQLERWPAGGPHAL